MNTPCWGNRRMDCIGRVVTRPSDWENGAFGESDIEGKAAMGSGERAGKRTSFNRESAIPQPRDREVTVERSGKLPRYKTFTDVRRASADEHQYDVRGRRWVDCIGRLVIRPSDWKIASQFAEVFAAIKELVAPPVPPRKQIGFHP